MAINQQDLEDVRNVVSATVDKSLFIEHERCYTNIYELICRDNGELELVYKDRVEISDDYQKEFKYPVYISYHSTLYGIVFNDYGMVVKQIKKSYGELMWKEIVSKAPNTSEKLSRDLFYTDEPTYHLEWYPVSEGYDLSGLPSSCMKGCGDRFEPLDNIAQMAVLVNNRTDQKVARCVVWNEGIVKNTTTGRINKVKLYDRLYYVDGEAETDMEHALRDEGIDPVDYTDTCEYYIDNPFPEDYDNYPWLDTFCLFTKKDANKLYCYDWQEYGYEERDINDLYQSFYNKYGVIGALLSQNNKVVYALDYTHPDGFIYSSYLEENISKPDAIYSRAMRDWLRKEDAFYSSYDHDWYPIDGEMDIWLPIYEHGKYDSEDTTYVTYCNTATNKFIEWIDPRTDTKWFVEKNKTKLDVLSGNYMPDEFMVKIANNNYIASFYAPDNIPSELLEGYEQEYLAKYEETFKECPKLASDGGRYDYKDVIWIKDIDRWKLRKDCIKSSYNDEWYHPIISSILPVYPNTNDKSYIALRRDKELSVVYDTRSKARYLRRTTEISSENNFYFSDELLGYVVHNHSVSGLIELLRSLYFLDSTRNRAIEEFFERKDQ